MSNESKRKELDNDLALINSVAHNNYSAGEVYIFSVVLCDNDVDKDFEYFHSDSLEKLARMFVGVSGICDSDPFKENQNSRIYRCRTEYFPTKQTAYSAEYVRLVADAYIPMSEANKNLIFTIDSGIKKEVSIACGIDKCSCSICGEDIRASKCKHKKGKIYNGKICCGVLKSPTDIYEWRFAFKKKQDGIDKKAETVKKPKRANMSNDLISRQAAIEAYLETVEPIAVQEWNGEISACARDRGVLKMLENLPSVQPKTGRWILDTTRFLPEYVCTNCKSRFPLVAREGCYGTLCCKNMNYCPNCGAKMEDEKNESDIV